MIPHHLSGFHLMWFDLVAVLFLENPKIRGPLRRIVKRGTTWNPIHKSKTKALFADIKISYTISFISTRISMFHIYIRRLQCAIAR